MKSLLALSAYVGLCAVLLTAAPALAAPVSARGKAQLVALHPLTLVRKGDLDFGMITRTAAGTAVINPDTNIMTTTGGVAALGGLPTAATFVGAAGSASVVIIRLPRAPLFITRVGGTETMRVDNWTLQGGTDKRTLARQESFEFRVGATLNVGAAQLEGTYVGTFDVTVQYP